MHAQLLEGPRDLESRRALLDDEQVVALVAALAIRLRDDQRPAATGAAGDEDLAAVDDEVVALLPRGGGDAGYAGDGVRLGDRERGDVLAADRRDDPFAFLLLGPELEDGWRRHLGLNVDRHAQAAQPGFGHLLREHDRREVVAALAAVLGRVAQAEEAELAEALEDGVGEGRLLPLLEVRLDLGGEELSDVEAELVVGVREVHRGEFRPERSGGCLRYDSPPWIPFGKSRTPGRWIGLGNQEAAQEDAQAQAQEDAEEDAMGATCARVGTSRMRF